MPTARDAPLCILCNPYGRSWAAPYPLCGPHAAAQDQAERCAAQTRLGRARAILQFISSLTHTALLALRMRLGA